MLQLATTTDKLQLVTSAAATVDVHCSYVDHTLSNDNVEGAKQNTAITTATTTDILAAPASAAVRRVKVLTVRNKHASVSCVVTVVFDQNGTDYELHQEFLPPGASLQYMEGFGFFRTLPNYKPIANVNTADETANAADTYLAASKIAIAATAPIVVGTVFRWTFGMTKTAAGTAAAAWNVRFGTNGTTADTSRSGALNLGAQTAAVDAGYCRIQAIVRGPIGVSCIVHFLFDFERNLATTGLHNANHSVQQVASSGFDITTSGLIVGVSVNPGASGVWTFQSITAEVLNI
jgi:hypothetical protein